MERVLYNLHLRLCTYALRTSSNRSRSWAERGILLVSICCFGALYMSHRSFVYRPLSNGSRSGASSNLPLTCLPSIRGFSREAAITHIILLDDYHPSTVGSHLPSTVTTTTQESSYAYTIHNRTLLTEQTCSAYNNICQEPTRQKQQIYISYSQVKGYLLLPPALVQDLPVQYVKVSPRDSRCFGEPFLQEIIFHLMSPETVIINWLLGLEDNEGYAYHPRTDTLMDLHPSEERLLVLGSQIGFKLSVVLRTCFLFFISTTLVSFTLRETQERMLDFTHQLQNHVRNRQPVVNLVTRHFIDNLVFCPIMVGMIFFLIEFYHGDKALAFMVLSIVWLAEVFSVISLRSTNGLHFFPRIFFLLFSLFHFYLFSFPFGFRHTALACTALFMVHSMLFFWHRFELPAVALGRVSVEQPRMRPSPPHHHHQHPSSSTSSSSSSPWPIDTNIPPPLRREPLADNPTQQLNRHNHHHNHHQHHLHSNVDHGRHQPDHSSRYHATTTTTASAINPLVSSSGNSLSTLSANPRPIIQRSHSHVSNSSQGNNNNNNNNNNGNNMSRQTSASGLYMGDEDGDESFFYFMSGEVVMPRRRSSAQQQQQQRIPDHVLAAVDVDPTQTPVRDNLSTARQALGPEHPRSRTAPPFPTTMANGHSDHSRSSISSSGA